MFMESYGHNMSAGCSKRNHGLGPAVKIDHIQYDWEQAVIARSRKHRQVIMGSQ